MKQCARNSPEGVSPMLKRKGKKHKTQPQGGKKLDCQQKYKKKGKCAKKRRRTYRYAYIENYDKVSL